MILASNKLIYHFHCVLISFSYRRWQ